MTDCRPISLFSLQTAERLSCELGDTVDKRRFRANIYIDLAELDGFGEETFLSRQLQIGEKAVIQVVHRAVRCKVVTLDPDTAEADPRVMRLVGKSHSGAAGIYGVVIAEGLVRPNDDILLLPQAINKPGDPAELPRGDTIVATGNWGLPQLEDLNSEQGD